MRNTLASLAAAALLSQAAQGQQTPGFQQTPGTAGRTAQERLARLATALEGARPLPPNAAAAVFSSRPSRLANAGNLVTFDYQTAEVRRAENGSWQLVAGTTVLKDFGPREDDARQALRLVRELRLTQLGTVGTPRPVMEYWLSDGRAPAGLTRGLRTLVLNPHTLKVQQVQGHWCICHGERVLFSFGSHEAEARAALEIIVHYEFGQVGYVGRQVPSVIVFLAGGTTPQAVRPGGLLTSPVTNPQGQPAAAPYAALQSVQGPDNSRRTEPRPVVPVGQQLLGGQPFTPESDAAIDRVPFDWRQVQLRRDGADWKLVAGSTTLANFGPEEWEARRGLAAVQFYRFTEHCTLGWPQPVCRYFLSGGRAPRGLQFGSNNLSFRPESLSVKQITNRWVLGDGGRFALYFDREEDAAKVLQIIRRHKFDHWCQVGRPGPEALTFFTRKG